MIGNFIFCPDGKGSDPGLTWENFCNAVQLAPISWILYCVGIVLYILLLRYYLKRHALVDRAMSIALIFSFGIWIYFILNQLESYRTILWWEGTNRPWILLNILISFYIWFVVYVITYFLLKIFKRNP